MNCPTCDHDIGPCREYRGVLNVNGYGCVNFGPERRDAIKRRGRKQLLLHRWVVEQVIGRKLRSDEKVRHICDRAACFRYDHLRLGTQAENMADMKRKGRSHKALRNATPQRILTEEQAREVKRLLRDTKLFSHQIGAMFGVSGSYIRTIACGKTFAYVRLDEEEEQ